MHQCGIKKFLTFLELLSPVISPHQWDQKCDTLSPLSQFIHVVKTNFMAITLQSRISLLTKILTLLPPLALLTPEHTHRHCSIDSTMQWHETMAHKTCIFCLLTESQLNTELFCPAPFHWLHALISLACKGATTILQSIKICQLHNELLPYNMYWEMTTSWLIGRNKLKLALTKLKINFYSDNSSTPKTSKVKLRESNDCTATWRVNIHR